MSEGVKERTMNGKHRKGLTIAALVSTLGAATVLWGWEQLLQFGKDELTEGSSLYLELSAKPVPAAAFSVLVPGSLDAIDQVDLENSGSAVMDWAEGHGGYAAGALGVELTVYGKADHPIILEGIDAKILSRDEPPTGTWFMPAGAGDLLERVVSIDLDAAEAKGEPTLDEVGNEWKFPLQVSQAEAERFYVLAGTEESIVSFELEVVYTDNGVTQSQTIDNKGEPFKVAASSAATAEAAWEIVDDRVRVASD